MKCVYCDEGITEETGHMRWTRIDGSIISLHPICLVRWLVIKLENEQSRLTIFSHGKHISLSDAAASCFDDYETVIEKYARNFNNALSIFGVEIEKEKK